MNSQCAKCGMQMAMPWSFCPHCGTAMKHEVKQQIQHVEPEHTSAPGGFGGLIVGFLIAPAFIIVGTLLCLTGLGGILGIPMIIAAVAAPLVGPMIGLGAHKGKCPSCGTVVGSVTDAEVHDCPTCRAQFAIGGGTIAKAG